MNILNDMNCDCANETANGVQKIIHNRAVEPVFLLVMPRIVNYVGEGYVFSIGLPYVSASLKASGYSVVTINLNHHEGKESDVLKDLIAKHHINIVATGGLSPQYHIVKNIIKETKSIDPNIITVVGGGIISADPIVAMTALEYADYGIKDDGEITIREFAKAIRNGEPLNDIAGMVLPVDGSFRVFSSRETEKDQDSIPWADYEGFDLDLYLELPSPSSSGLNASRIVHMLMGRSCPYKCTFCFRSAYQKYVRRSFDNFFSQLDYLIEKYQIDHVTFADELFLPKQQDLKEFCERMMSYDVTWDADFSISCVKEELLPLMKKSGLTLMAFGLESADDSVLKSMNKKFSVKKMEEVLKMVHEHQIPFFGAFIFGDVGETFATANRTLQWWRDHPQYLIHLTFIKTYPGTAVYHYACDQGIIKDKIKYLEAGCPQVNVSSMSDHEFAMLARGVADAIDSSIDLDSVELVSLNKENGIMAMKGVCPICSHTNHWNDVKLFSINYLACDHCTQKFHIPLLPAIRRSIEDNMSALLKGGAKVAVWGMTLSAMELFKVNGVFHESNVYPIDISLSKQNMDLYGKRVYGPSVINELQISTVVIAVPFYVSQISHQITENHPCVTNVIDICELVS
ncbi:MAG: radical SAM protein [Lamprobacter sp.]|uniref:B12-binding domain-containing radical SAM protein n=1 Tax=Lamprobacter sp. TaxID=3100796 RepID=UPI002B264565|nr:radical SAM protein [Lamprobacter sp.]MEA3641491.1 radical SAM protein [Lamprobacter sp.]